MSGGVISRSLSMALCGLGLAGCVSLGNDRLFNETTLTQIKAGVTTKAQVVELIGEPSYQRQTVMSGHSYEWWAYDAEQSTVNPVEYLLVVGLLFNGIGTPDDRRDLQLFFDPDGVLTHVHHQTTSYENGGIFTLRNVTAQTKTGIGRLNQPGGPTGYQDVMAVSPGP